MLGTRLRLAPGLSFFTSDPGVVIEPSTNVWAHMGLQYSACQAARLPPTPWCRQTLSPPLTQGHSEKGVESQARSVPGLWGEMGTPYYPGKCPHTSLDMDAQNYLNGGAVYQDTHHAYPLGSTTHADPWGPEPQWYLSCHSAASLVHTGPTSSASKCC